MGLKQRKGRLAGATVAAFGEKDRSGSGHNTGKERSRKTNNDKSNLICLVFAFYTLVGGILCFYYLKYGPSMFLGKGWKDYTWTPSKWRKFIDNNERTILLIGGPHRAGTTIIWEAIKAHPEIVGFGDRFDTGVDYSEGVLMQDIYPRFGVGLEFRNYGKKDGHGKRVDGMGRYALNPDVHWTKENKQKLLQDPSTMSRLLNRFAPHWDQNKKFGSNGMMKAKVWVEKSPQNAVLSTFLEGVYNMPLEKDEKVVTNNGYLKESRRLATKFLYVTRHPIANIYATGKFVRDAMGGNIDFEILLKNYIELHKYMKIDEKALESPVMWVRLEDFASTPTSVLKEIFSFLDVSADEGVIQYVLKSIANIHSEPNAKYATEWCREGIRKHGLLIDKYADELITLGLGYDLDICK
mmetsp:Transcript_42340/g.90069  ORF Transcript_42340/g.90069 Transcript_42340/m.90069 type:complete len:409 (-) Transcript_42340:92-1318(-)